MPRVPGYLLLALAGLILVSASILSIFSVDAQAATNPLAPTVLALLTQLPPQAAATQLAAQGYSFSPAMLATAQAMLQQMPAPAVVETLLANVPNPGIQPTQPPPTVVPVQPTMLPPTAVPLQPTLVPVQPTTLPGGVVPVQPTTLPGETAPMQPSPTLMAAAPTATLSTPMPVGRISGSALSAESAATGIELRLTRPDGTTLILPPGADGLFAFANMPPGAYILEAAAAGFLSGKAAFTLQAGQDLALPPLTLPAGDTNGDNLIDLSDAVLLAANFNAPPPVPAADLNGDGWIDVLDLALLGNAFGLTGPLAWN